MHPHWIAPETNQCLLLELQSLPIRVQCGFGRKDVSFLWEIESKISVVLHVHDFPSTLSLSLLSESPNVSGMPTILVGEWPGLVLLKVILQQQWASAETQQASKDPTLAAPSVPLACASVRQLHCYVQIGQGWVSSSNLLCGLHTQSLRHDCSLPGAGCCTPGSPNTIWFVLGSALTWWLSSSCVWEHGLSPALVLAPLWPRHFLPLCVLCVWKLLETSHKHKFPFLGTVSF